MTDVASGATPLHARLRRAPEVTNDSATLVRRDFTGK